MKTQGFRLNYIDKNFEGQLARKDYWIDFKHPAATEEEIKVELAKMVEEARVAMRLVTTAVSTWTICKHINHLKRFQTNHMYHLEETFQ